jgi:pimeloyl-ACP methyl ester carboxylesterase
LSSIELREERVSTNGITINLAIAGDPSAPALLLLHGLYDRWETWEPVIPSLAARFHVLAPDLRGHARSDHPDHGYTFRDYADDILGLLDSREISQVVAIGHSLGALVAARFAASWPDRTRALVLVDPPLEQNQDTRTWLQILLDAKREPESETYEIIKELNIMSGDEHEWSRQTDWLRSTADGPFEALIQLIDNEDTAQLVEVLEQISTPTLLMQADPASGGALSDRAADLAMHHLQNARLHRFEGTGHSIHLEQNEAFLQAVEQFLQSQS